MCPKRNLRLVLVLRNFKIQSPTYQVYAHVETVTLSSFGALVQLRKSWQFTCTQSTVSRVANFCQFLFLEPQPTAVRIYFFLKLVRKLTFKSASRHSNATYAAPTRADRPTTTPLKFLSSPRDLRRYHGAMAMIWPHVFFQGLSTCKCDRNKPYLTNRNHHDDLKLPSLFPCAISVVCKEWLGLMLAVPDFGRVLLRLWMKSRVL